MNALILAAGYGTRLKPLTNRIAKPLVPVADKPLVQHVVEWIADAKRVERIWIVTNERYWRQFVEWRDAYESQTPIELINDGSTCNENRLGAIRDIRISLDAIGSGDLLVTAGDNIFPFPLAEMLAVFDARRAPVIAVYEQNDPDLLRRTGVAKVDETGRVVDFEEKPPEPKSNLAAPPIYVFPENALRRFDEYLADPVNPDAPGHFIAWLCGRVPVYAYRFHGERYAVDDPITYKRVDEALRRRAAGG